MRVDPVGEGLNLYLYVQNNPLKYIDPEGLIARSAWNATSQWAKDYGKELNDFYITPVKDTASYYKNTPLRYIAVDTAVSFTDVLSVPEDITDWATQTTGVERMAAATQTTGPSPAFYADDALVAAPRILKTVGKAAGNYIKGFSSSNKSTRFIASNKGDIVDIVTTPPGRYIQPDRSATDILQRASHPGVDDFISRTHTHKSVVNVNPNDPTRSSIKLSKEVSAVTSEEITNIMKGTAKSSTSRGH